MKKLLFSGFFFQFAQGSHIKGLEIHLTISKDGSWFNWLTKEWSGSSQSRFNNTSKQAVVVVIFMKLFKITSVLFSTLKYQRVGGVVYSTELAWKIYLIEYIE